MESSKYTDDTLAAYLDLMTCYNNMGVVLQSALKRSASDLLHLLEVEGTVRLVKGAYQENEEIAFRSNTQINTNFIKLLDIVFGITSNTRNNSHGYRIPNIKTNNNNKLMFAIATHDSRLIEYAIELWKKSRIDRANFELQFLRGIRHELRRDLAERGFRIAEYIPYGKEYLHYAIRRLREKEKHFPVGSVFSPIINI